MNLSPSNLSSNVISLAQKAVCDILNADSLLSSACEFFPENMRDIEFQMRDALMKQGIAGVVMTPSLSYRGRDVSSMWFDMADAEIDITENPAVNRASTKPLSSYASAQDVACRAIQALASPAFSNAGNFSPKKVTTGEYTGLLVSKVTFDCLAELHSKPEGKDA